MDRLPELLSSRLSDSELAIFLFHGVMPRNTKGVRNYTGKHMRLDNFQLCMSKLCSVGNPISIERATSLLEEGAPFPERSFVISFDDGFENNYSVAMPVMVDLGVKPVIYVTTNFINLGEQSWIDKIESVVEVAKPCQLKLDWLKDVMSMNNREQKIAFLKEVRHYVKKNPTVDPYKFASDLIDQLGESTVPDYDDYLDKKLSWEQIRHLSQSGLATIGGHSHTHRILSFLAYEELEFEINTSLHLMQSMAGVTVYHYSYPEGLSHCFNDTVIDLLKNSGVRCCPTAIDGTNPIGSNTFLLKRIMVA